LPAQAEVAPDLNNLSLMQTDRFADTKNRDRNTKSQSAGGLNCENTKQGPSEERKKKTDFRKAIWDRYVSIHLI
jgi:hypothetical protein